MESNGREEANQPRGRGDAAQHRPNKSQGKRKEICVLDFKKHYSGQVEKRSFKTWPENLLRQNRNILHLNLLKRPFIVTATAISFDNTKSHKGLPLFDVLC